MNHKLINNHNYPTLESILDASGDLNTALVKSSEFQKLKIYQEILDKTEMLNVFPDMKFKYRVNFLCNNVQIQYCPTCGKPYFRLSNTTRKFALCRHKQFKDGLDLGNILKTAKQNRLNDFLKTLSDKTQKLNDIEYNRIMSELAIKPDNYAFIVTNSKYSDFYHDLIVKTEHILPIINDNLMISRRIYLQMNNLTVEPLCRYCGHGHVVFINRKKGYNDSCCECSQIKSNLSREISNKELINKYFNFSKYEILSYPGLLNRDPIIIKCKKCGYETKRIINNGSIKNLHDMPLCEHCESQAGHEETDLYEFIKTIYGKTIIHRQNSRKIIPPYELDIYLPDIKTAFEYDGIYWHSEKEKPDPKYHLIKTNKCQNLGIQLIHIFSNEWLYKQDIVKSRIKNIFGIYDKTVFARKCDIRKIDLNISKSFQDENHLQGAVNSSVNLGLFFKNKLISLMTFGKCRFGKKYEWELMRFCNKCGYHIPGAASRLLKHFEKTYRPKSVVSYADRRWSCGKLYNAIGFTFVHNSKPNYWYFKNHDIQTLYSRINFQKHKLKNKLEKFDVNKTEVENMKDNGYYRIFDCGNMVFEKIYN